MRLQPMKRRARSKTLPFAAFFLASNGQEKVQVKTYTRI
jgi:hypothetical protein